MKPVFDKHFIFFAKSLENLLELEAVGVKKLSPQEWVNHQKNQLRNFT